MWRSQSDALMTGCFEPQLFQEYRMEDVSIARVEAAYNRLGLPPPAKYDITRPSPLTAPAHRGPVKSWIEDKAAAWLENKSAALSLPRDVTIHSNRHTDLTCVKITMDHSSFLKVKASNILLIPTGILIWQDKVLSSSVFSACDEYVTVLL